MNKTINDSNITADKVENPENNFSSKNFETDVLKTNLHLTKSFNFTKKKVFKAFTEAKYFEKWFGTYQSKITIYEMNFHEGGKLALKLETESGKREFEGEYHEIIEKEKLIFSLKAIEEGQVIYETLNTVVFIEPEPGTTNISVNIEVIKADQNKAGSAIKGTELGWTDGFEKLEKLLTKLNI